MENEILLLAAFLLFVSLSVLVFICLNSYSRRRRIGAIATKAMLDVALDLDSSLYYTNVKFVHNGNRYLIDHLVFTEKNVYALNSVDLIGENKIKLSSDIVRMVLGFVPMHVGNTMAELESAVIALSEYLSLRKREELSIVRIVALTGTGLVHDGCQSEHIYLENLILEMADIEERTKHAVLSPQRIVDCVLPNLGDSDGGMDLTSVEKLRYDEAERIANRARKSGFGADGYGRPMSNFDFILKWFKDNF